MSLQGQRDGSEGYRGFKPEDLSLIPGTCMVGEKNLPVTFPPCVLGDTAV